MGGGENDPAISRLEVDRRLLIDNALWMLGLPFVWVDGGRDGDRTVGDATDGSIGIERRRSERDARP